MGLPREGKGDVDSVRTRVSCSGGSSGNLIVPRRASEGSRNDAEDPPLWAWYSQPNIGGPKGSLIAPLAAPNTPTSFPLDSSFHEAIRQRLFNTGEVPMAPLYVPSRVHVVQGVQIGSSVTPAAYPTYGHAGAPTAVVTTVVPLGSQSTHMICPHCHADVDTATKLSPSMVAWLSGFIICILGGVMGCCLVPCCINDCMNVEHSCPNCHAFLGKYNRG
ncbi:lipopolysaccharide-induced tumor necrosis factor-alpha factor-like isoform X1 [Homarus americanus]|uniref:lipopolysaccharide-induced tumor necrosis factor-alpha factor-like isoform X1 n=1 Tax=Homarus americanus TaxID=6706 RepID=UPI001C484279|nr:lipopolysaccharide-induced tumor necrosis factor-alpha factor-like isoform X1 [Homarus americanus]XP_042233049.1 lipopolysaccharide-induced tumor necrosis factor-alpha factor-like isoform X1 [Homarus americanus]